jgi:hypothetical protein
LRTADAYAFARLDLGTQARNGPVGPVCDGGGQQGHGHAQCRLAFDWRGSGGNGGLQRFNAAPHEIAAPEPNGVLTHAERFGNTSARPARQRQQHGAGAIRLAAIA